MPYFRNNEINILFLHIPKTGGTSLEHYFSRKYNIPLNKDSLYMKNSESDKKYVSDLNLHCSLQHLTYNDLKNNSLFNIDYNKIKIITIVRNPYDRIISDLFFNKLIDKDSTKEETYNIIYKYLFNDNTYDNHRIPQHLFIMDQNNKILDNIIIMHTENLVNDMVNAGYTDFNMYINVNRQKNLNYNDYLNSDSINLINKYYENDFILFGYNKRF